MSGFSTHWLDLREDADRRARSAGLEARLAAHFAGRQQLDIVDLGCGTGANARALAPSLPGAQAWRFVDHDADLLAAAQARMAAWARADACSRPLDINYQMAELGGDLRAVVRPGDDLVTAAAFFDLVSPEWIARFAAAVAGAGAAFHTALIYDGEETWLPAHPADEAVLAAFRQHQRRDKGFGPAAGPEAADLLIRAFAEAGYEVHAAASPWRLDACDAMLIRALADGTARAARDTRCVDAETAHAWRAARAAAHSAIIGHVDLLALPPD